MKIRLLGRLYLPSSVLAGLLGLVLIQVAPDAMAVWTEKLTEGWDALPGFLINIVFPLALLVAFARAAGAQVASRLRGALIALRRNEAEHILVTRVVPLPERVASQEMS